MIWIGATCLCMCLSLLHRKIMGWPLDFLSIILCVIIPSIVGMLCVVWVLDSKWYKSKFGQK